MVVFATPEQHRKVSDLREAFDESNLPFRVDLFVWDAVPKQFHKQIEADHVVLVEAEERGSISEWRETTLKTIGFDRNGQDSKNKPFRVLRWEHTIRYSGRLRWRAKNRIH